MAAPHLRPQTLEERLIFWPIVSTWGLWLLGAQFVVFPLLGVALVGLGLARRWGLTDRFDPIASRNLPPSVIVWCLGMALMLAALIIGHIDFDLGLYQTIKSSLGWLKGWALLALFPLAGTLLRIRPAIIFRAVNMLALQTLILTPILVATAFLGLPEQLYVSPLHMVVGSEPVFFTVSIALAEPGTLGFRLVYFAPWAPAAAYVATVFYVLALFDKDWRWRAIGVAASISMSFFTMSRMSIIAIPLVTVSVIALSYVARPLILSIIAPVIALSIAFAEPVMQVAEQIEATFTGARANSSRVRSTIQRIGLHRWQEEAPVFGHGVVERGPHLVEYMPIGSHHTWVGLLFVKGLVGFFALLIPLSVAVAEAIAKSQRDRLARCALGVLLVLVLFSFGENMDVLAYLIWPGLLIVGLAARRRYREPWYSAVIKTRRHQAQPAIA